ncbi:TyeA family type III secretion system gatekeeper subunit [Cupriavidus sp. ISTL7]|nr:TyeA family type III secretion system gatekeeper subunit [Cupriavidus sp. ISTL7]
MPIRRDGSHEPEGTGRQARHSNRPRAGDSSRTGRRYGEPRAAAGQSGPFRDGSRGARAQCFPPPARSRSQQRALVQAACTAARRPPQRCAVGAGLRRQAGQVAAGQQGPRIEQLLQQFGDIDDVDSLFAAIERSELHPAAMALLLAAMAQQHRPGRKRSRLEEALERRLGASGDWELAMLGWLEFGAMTPELMSQLKSLYQRAGVVQQGMAAFLDQLAGIGERRRKVKVLIRALGAELSGIEDDAAEGIKLAAVVRDLKRLLVFLGCEEQCGRIARALGEPPVEPDTVLRLLIRMVDQPWLYHDWIRGEIEGMQLGRERGFKLARDITRLAKLLPEPCFRDDDHRQQVLAALNEFNDRAENADPAEGDATG